MEANKMRMATIRISESDVYVNSRGTDLANNFSYLIHQL